MIKAALNINPITLYCLIINIREYTNPYSGSQAFYGVTTPLLLTTFDDNSFADVIDAGMSLVFK